jgi:hypothetical protein
VQDLGFRVYRLVSVDRLELASFRGRRRAQGLGFMRDFALGAALGGLDVRRVAIPLPCSVPR